jgi:hypothetical protein
MTMKPWRLFTEHPASVGESYTEHALKAVSFGWSMLRGACACFLHAVFPWVCTTVGSRTVVRLYGRMVTRRSGHRIAETGAHPALDFLAEHI